MIRVDVTTPPASEPVVLADMRAHSRIDAVDTAQDDVLTLCIQAARAHIENSTGRAMLTQTIRQTLDEFPPCGEPIVLMRSPVQSITSVTYTDTNGTTQTMSPSDYVTSIGQGISQVGLAGVNQWPAARIQPGAVQVTFVAGYASAGLVPADLRAAIRMLAALYFEQREAVLTGTIATQVPMAVEAIINANRSGLQM